MDNWVGILGGLEASRLGAPVPIGAGAHSVALNLLAATPNGDIGIDELVETLQEHSPQRAWSRHNIYSAVTRIRQRLPGVVVSTRTRHYAIDLTACDVDAQQFTRRARDGAQALRDADPARAVGLLRSGLALWRGPALADVRRLRSVEPLATRLDDLRVGATEDLALALIGSAAAAEAVALLEDVVTAHPLGEHGWALLVQALQLSGPAEQAWAAFDRARLVLSDAGMEPGLELTDAVNRIPGNSTPSAPRMPRPVRPATDAFVRIAAEQALVGRSAEVAELEAAMAAVAAGGGARLLLLEGEPGIGKSRLTAELGMRAGRSGHMVWYEICPPRLEVSFGPVLNWVRRMLVATDPTTRRRLLEGPLGRLTTTGGERSETDPTRDRWLLYEAIADLAATASAGGAVLVLDDLHRSDPDTLDLLHHVLSTRADAQLLVIATIRDRERLDPSEPLWHLPSTARMRVEGLDRDAAAELASQLLGDESPLSPHAGAKLQRFTGGNPLFISTVVRDRAVFETVLHERAPRPSHVHRPPVVQAVARYVAGLGADARKAIEIGSVLGEMFDANVLLTTAAGAEYADAAGLIDGLRAAVVHGLLLADPDTPDRYLFVHGLVRSTVYGELPAERRSALHLAAGRALELFDRGSDSAVLADHFGRAWPACPASTASRYLRLAAEHAARMLRFDRAQESFTLAAEMLLRDPGHIDHVELAELWVLAGRARTDAGRMDEAQEAFLAAAEVASGVPHDELLVLAAIGYAETLGMRRPSRRGIDLMRRAADVDDADPDLRAEAIATLHNVDAARAFTRSNEVLHRTHGSSSMERVPLLERLCWHRLGEDRLALAAELSAIGSTTHDRVAAALGFLHGWVAEIQLGRRGFDDPLAHEGATLVDQAGSVEVQWTWMLWLATVAMNRGPIDDADELIEAARRMRFPAPEAARSLYTRPTRLDLVHASQRGMYEGVRGQRSVEERSFEVMREAPASRAHDRRPFEALVLVRSGRFEEAAAVCRDVLDGGVLDGPATADWLVNAVTLADTMAALADRSGCERLLETLSPFADLHAFVGLVHYHGSVRHHLGLLNAALGRHDTSVEELRVAVAAHERVGSRLYTAYSTLQLAGRLHVRAKAGDRTEAEHLRRVALAISEKVGMGLTTRPWPPAR